MKIRGHHLFCMALFSGHGYNTEFTEHMKAVLGALDRGEPMELSQGKDEICRVCPNLLSDGTCSLGDLNVQRRDAGAFRVLGLLPGEALDRREVNRRLSRLTEEEFQAVCGECRWQKEGLCSLKLLQAKTMEK